MSRAAPARRPRDEAATLADRLDLRDEVGAILAADLHEERERRRHAERALAGERRAVDALVERLDAAERELRAARTFVRQQLLHVLGRRAGR